MSCGFVDSASLHTIILALRNSKTTDWTPWMRETVLGTTVALWSHPQFSIAPDPSPHQGSRGPFDRLLKALSPFFSGIASQDEAALQKTRQWVRDNPIRVKHLYDQVSANISFPQWLDSYISFFFVRHSQMHGGLFTYEFIPQLSQVIGCPPQDLERLYELSGNPKQVEKWVKKLPNTESFSLLKDAFVISTLMRGRYHDYAAKNSGLQIMHHPMREVVLPRKKVTSEFVLSNTEQFLTSLVLHSALNELRLDARINLWAENIIKVKTAISQQKIDLLHKDSVDVALDSALNAAKQADIRFHPRYMEVAFDLVVSAGMGALTAFTLAPWLSISPWVGVVVGVARQAVTKPLKIGERSARLFYGSRNRLLKLAEAEPGRIQRLMREPNQ